MSEENLYERLLDKSQELFVLAIELFNRPSLTYHAEACAVFLCSAWELMLKAHIVKVEGNEALYYRENDRTLSLEDCLKKVFTNENDPLRKNMNKVIQLRNTSTHFVTSEYEIFYGPILQSSVSNYEDKLEKLHGRNISDVLPDNYLNLSVRKTFVDEDQVRAKYSPEVADKLLRQYNDILIEAGDGNIRYAAYYRTELALVKGDKKADLSVRVDKDGTPVAIIKETKDHRTRYPFRHGMAVTEVQNRLKRSKIQFTYNGEPKTFNKHHLDIFIKFYSVKSEQRYAWNRAVKGETPDFTYSQQLIDLIVEEIRKNSDIVTVLKSELKKRN